MGILTETFAKRLAYMLELRNMKPVELAEKSGVSASAISNYLSGRFRPKQQRTFLFSKILDCDPAFLMGVNIEPPKKTMQFTPPEQTLIKKYRRLSDANKQAVNTMVDSLLAVENSSFEKDERSLR